MMRLYFINKRRTQEMAKNSNSGSLNPCRAAGGSDHKGARSDPYQTTSYVFDDTQEGEDLFALRNRGISIRA